jgi:hypothetical protein
MIAFARKLIKAARVALFDRFGHMDLDKGAELHGAADHRTGALDAQITVTPSLVI